MNTTSVPAEAVSIYNRALEFSNKGELDTALTEYRRAIELYPNFIEAYNNIGEIYSQKGDRSSAISTYLEALKITRNYRILLNIGVEHYNERKYKEALTYFNESLKLKKDFLEGHYYTGMAWHNLQDYQNAEKHFVNVIAQDPKHLKVNYLLSYIYYEWKEYKKSIECLDRIKDIADDISFINRYYGFCYYHLGDFDKAITHLTVALESNPEYERFREYLNGLTYENKLKEVGDVDKAIKELEKKMKKEGPGLREATRLSMLYIFKGEHKKAEDLVVSVKETLAS